MWNKRVLNIYKEDFKNMGLAVVVPVFLSLLLVLIKQLVDYNFESASMRFYYNNRFLSLIVPLCPCSWSMSMMERYAVDSDSGLYDMYQKRKGYINFFSYLLSIPIFVILFGYFVKSDVQYFKRILPVLYITILLLVFSYSLSLILKSAIVTYIVVVFYQIFCCVLYKGGTNFLVWYSAGESGAEQGKLFGWETGIVIVFYVLSRWKKKQ